MKISRCFLILMLTALSSLAFGRDTIVNIPLADVLEMPEAKTQLTIKFYLKGMQVPASAKILGSDVSNRKTNAVNKTDEFACKWVILSALISLQSGALKHGGNAVVDIVSFYKSNETQNDKTIECHAGSIIAGAALKGNFAKL